MAPILLSKTGQETLQVHGLYNTIPCMTRFFSRAIWGLSEDSGPSESETAHFDHRNQHLEVLVPGRQLVAEMWDY